MILLSIALKPNCPQIKNYNQEDINNNNIGDACENDFDDDGVLNGVDNCKFKYNPDQADLDKDGAGNVCDASDSRWTETNKWLLWFALGIAILVMGYFGVKLLKSIQEETGDITKE